MSEATQTTLYCANHPDRPTNLRCNRCNKTICAECAVLTPTGYRCRECVRGQQKTFETAQWVDYPVSFILSLTLSFAGSYVASLLGFFTIFIAPVAGVATAEVVRWAVRRRRSRRLYQISAAGAILGSLPIILMRGIGLLAVFAATGSVSSGLFGLLPLAYGVLYAFLMVSTFYYRLAGIQIG